MTKSRRGCPVCCKIKGCRQSCGHLLALAGATGLPQNDAIEWKTSLTSGFNMLKTNGEMLVQENSDLKQVVSELSERIVALEAKIRTMIPIQAYIFSAQAPPPPPPPMPASPNKLSNNFPICPQTEIRRPPPITTEDLKQVKLRKTGLL